MSAAAQQAVANKANALNLDDMYVDRSLLLLVLLRTLHPSVAAADGIRSARSM